MPKRARALQQPWRSSGRWAIAWESPDPLTGWGLSPRERVTTCAPLASTSRACRCCRSWATDRTSPRCSAQPGLGGVATRRRHRSREPPGRQPGTRARAWCQIRQSGEPRSACGAGQSSAQPRLRRQPVADREIQQEQTTGLFLLRRDSTEQAHWLHAGCVPQLGDNNHRAASKGRRGSLDDGLHARCRARPARHRVVLIDRDRGSTGRRRCGHAPWPAAGQWAPPTAAPSHPGHRWPVAANGHVAPRPTPRQCGPATST